MLFTDLCSLFVFLVWFLLIPDSRELISSQQALDIMATESFVISTLLLVNKIVYILTHTSHSLSKVTQLLSKKTSESAVSTPLLLGADVIFECSHTLTEAIHFR